MPKGSNGIENGYENIIEPGEKEIKQGYAKIEKPSEKECEINGDAVTVIQTDLENGFVNISQIEEDDFVIDDPDYGIDGIVGAQINEPPRIIQDHFNGEHKLDQNIHLASNSAAIHNITPKANNTPQQVTNKTSAAKKSDKRKLDKNVRVTSNSAALYNNTNSKANSTSKETPKKTSSAKKS